MNKKISFLSLVLLSTFTSSLTAHSCLDYHQTNYVFETPSTPVKAYQAQLALPDVLGAVMKPFVKGIATEPDLLFTQFIQLATWATVALMFCVAYQQNDKKPEKLVIPTSILPLSVVTEGKLVLAEVRLQAIEDEIKLLANVLKITMDQQAINAVMFTATKARTEAAVLILQQAIAEVAQVKLQATADKRAAEIAYQQLTEDQELAQADLRAASQGQPILAEVKKAIDDTLKVTTTKLSKITFTIAAATAKLQAIAATENAIAATRQGAEAKQQVAEAQHNAKVLAQQIIEANQQVASSIQNESTADAQTALTVQTAQKAIEFVLNELTRQAKRN